MSRPDILHIGGTLRWVIRTRDPDTQLLKDADSTPTVVIVKNGTITGDSVTVTKRSATTGIYDCSYNPASEVEGDAFTVEESATVTGTTTAQATYANSWEFTVVVTASAISGQIAADIETDDNNWDVALANLVSMYILPGGVASQASVNTVDTVVDAIKAKTDQFVFTVANQVDANALTGGLDAAGVRTALGLASANLDTQLSTIDTTADSILSQLPLIPKGSITRDVSDTAVIYFSWTTETPTPTITVSIDGAAFANVSGAVTRKAIYDLAGEFGFQFAYNANDRPAGAGTAVYRITDGLVTDDLVLVVKQDVATGGGSRKVNVTVVDDSAALVSSAVVSVKNNLGVSLGITGTTSTLGVVPFNLDDGTYQFSVADRTGYEPHSPETFAVDEDNEPIQLTVNVAVGTPSGVGWIG